MPCPRQVLKGQAEEQELSVEERKAEARGRWPLLLTWLRSSLCRNGLKSAKGSGKGKSKATKGERDVKALQALCQSGKLAMWLCNGRQSREESSEKQ